MGSSCDRSSASCRRILTFVTDVAYRCEARHTIAEPQKQFRAISGTLELVISGICDDALLRPPHPANTQSLYWCLLRSFPNDSRSLAV